MNDWQLLREYVEHNSETAFATLAERHASLVYSTCLREVGDAALAEDVAQVVFVLLARKAASLREGTVLAGWLFQTARFACKNALRRERRRQQHEQKAAELMMGEIESSKTGWAQIEPLLHEGLAVLATPERDALLLRFFQNLSLRETGSALGISEDAARMRVARALEKLRRHFAKHGFATSAVILAALLSERAAQAAPASLLATASHVPTQLGVHIGVSSGAAGGLTPQVSALSHHILRAMLVKRISVAAGLGAVLLGSGATLLHFAATPVNSIASNAMPLSLTNIPQASTAARTAPIATTSVDLKPQATLFTGQRAPVVAPVVAPANAGKISKSSTFSHPRELRALLRSASARKTTQVRTAPNVALPSTPLIVKATVKAPEAPGKGNELPTIHSTESPVDPAPPVTTEIQEAPEVTAAETPLSAVNGAEVASTSTTPNSASTETGTLNRRGAWKQFIPRQRNKVKPDLRGRIVAINDSDGSISIRLPGAEAKTVTVLAEARIFIGDKAANLEDIQVGMNAKIRLEDNQNAIVIHAHAPSAPLKGLRQNLKLPKETKKNKRKLLTSTP